MSYWQTLGVEPGSDQRTIKRAYSRLLKEVHPEDHPEDFMALREAYEQALASAPKTAPRRMADADVSAPEPNWQRQPVPPPESVSPPDQPAAPEPVMSPEALAKKAAEQQAARQALADERERIQELHRQREQAVREEGARAQQRLDQLGNDFTQLVNDPQRRADAAAWDALLLAPDLNNLEVRLVVGRELLSALLDNLGDQERAAVPAAILVRLDERFQWSTDQSLNWGV
ncbi:MAG: DnaJ domain-containing protein, partial [Pseudomonas neustonica]